MYYFLFFISLYTTPYKQLQWSDFKMKPPVEEIAKGRIAHTETRWVLWRTRDENGPFVEPEFSFVPEASWTTTDSELTLAHENTHYLISILWFERFKKAMKKYRCCSDADYNKLLKKFNHCWDEQKKLQALFDKETRNGTNMVMEAQWEEQIEKELR